MKRGKKKRAGIVILAAVIVLVGAGIFFYYQTQYYLVLNGEKEVELNRGLPRKKAARMSAIRLK